MRCFSRDVAGCKGGTRVCVWLRPECTVAWSRVVGVRMPTWATEATPVSALRWEMGSGVSNGRRVASGFQMLVLAAVLQKGQKSHLQAVGSNEVRGDAILARQWLDSGYVLK